MAKVHDIHIKKQYGQHFLRDTSLLHVMFDAVTLDERSSIIEIGCGDGVLTKEILRHPCARLWVFEIDTEWAEYVKKNIHDTRLHVFTQNILDIQSTELEQHAPWTVLANLPYQITFPILYLLQRNRALIKEGVVMVQEEVAQKIVKTHGRGYGYPSLFLQYYFDFQLLNKIAPSAFYPQPKVYSRLLYFKSKQNVALIPDEQRFWHFIAACFKQPRRTLKNNLQQSNYSLNKLSPTHLQLRAQQMNIKELLDMWDLVR